MKILVSLSIIFSVMGITPSCRAFAHPPINQSRSYPGTLLASQSPDSLQRYVGSYELSPGQQLTISLVTDTLYILPPNETVKVALKSVGNNEFVVVGEEAHLLFKQDPMGKITTVEIRFGNGASVAGKKL